MFSRKIGVVFLFNMSKKIDNILTSGLIVSEKVIATYYTEFRDAFNPLDARFFARFT